MKTRRTYKPIRIDFTPFVSVALLLIVFFVWVKMVSEPNMMRTSLRSGVACFWDKLPSPDAHLFLLPNNRIGVLTYRPDGSEAELLETDYSAEGIRKQLIGITLNHTYGAIVAITPTEQATFKNIVDVLDELQILGHIHFHLWYQLTPEEKKMLASYETYKATNPSESKLIRMTLYKGIWDSTADFKRRKVRNQTVIYELLRPDLLRSNSRFSRPPM